MKDHLYLDSTTAVQQITVFLQDIFSRQKKSAAVVAVSGGIDSALVLTLLAKALSPDQIFPLFLPYGQDKGAQSAIEDAKLICQSNQIPERNWQKIDIQPLVTQAAQALSIDNETEDQVRLGNLMARCRMMIIFDQAKKLDALVVGTENRSEHELGYFTRFGDEASDIEPITHLYKTQVRQLASFLQLPAQFLSKQPSAGLWPGQTDEVDFGFSYQEADLVLAQHSAGKKHSAGKNQASEKDQPTTPTPAPTSAIVQQVLARKERFAFKHQVPYKLQVKGD